MIKSFILLLLLLTFFSYSYSQNTVPGYYVTKTHDTIQTQIRIPRSILGFVDFSKLLFKVEVNDSPGAVKKLKPEEIKSFGFLYDGQEYKFFSQPTITEKNLRFLQPLILGKETSLYQFQTADQNGLPLGIFYTFEKSNGTYAFLNTGIKSLDKFRDTLKEFYKDDITLHELINSKFQSRTSIKNDILEIVRAANLKVKN